MIYHKANPHVNTTQIKKQNLTDTSKASLMSPSSPPGNYGNHFLTCFTVPVYSQTL